LAKSTIKHKEHTLLSDFKEITKFGLSISVMISSVAGYLLGAETIDYKTLFLLIIGGYCMVGASNIYNQIIEIEPDKLMKRTKNRPLPAGRMKKQKAFYLAVVLTIVGLVALYRINPKTALFGAISIFLYVSAYTPMKPVSPISVLVGAFPGAIPFMLGWVAATNHFGIEAGILFLIQFLWQFPHFWAIGWLQFEEYKKAGFNMMPTLEKNKKASMLIIMYTIFMIIASLIPALKITGKLYLTPFGAILVLFSGLLMLYYAVQLHKKQDDKTARKLMLSSVLYITLIQIIFVIDKFLH
jgi:protoheme IX farnesyltransferase